MLTPAPVSITTSFSDRLQTAASTCDLPCGLPLNSRCRDVRGASFKPHYYRHHSRCHTYLHCSASLRVLLLSHSCSVPCFYRWSLSQTWHVCPWSCPQIDPGHLCRPIRGTLTSRSFSGWPPAPLTSTTGRLASSSTSASSSILHASSPRPRSLLPLLTSAMKTRLDVPLHNYLLIYRLR